MLFQFVLFCDGGSRGNPGPAASGYVIYKFPVGLKISNYDSFIAYKQQAVDQIISGKHLGTATNNFAEWQAVILGLTNIVKLNQTNFGSNDEALFEDGLGEVVKTKITVFLDSELVVRQAIGRYKVKNEDLKLCYNELKKLELNFNSVSYNHVYREFNKEADSEVNRILDEDS